ncbi:MAG: type II restriction endonuclease [Bacilli bacterium]|nr:type II restriction endonuclease [Bacilli bacterium]
MPRDFNLWLSTFRESIADYKYYIDFETVYKNILCFKRPLELLNSLVGSKKIEDDLWVLYAHYPEIVEAIPLLLAKREHQIYCLDKNGGVTYNFLTTENGGRPMTYEQLLYFMKETGLLELLSSHLNINLVDYAIGVEVGLNSNGRKNRGGHLMEDLVESFIVKAGFIKNKTYFKEMYLSDLEKISGLDLSALSNEGSTAKRFDFVLLTNNHTYACECNFYASGGSKLNETARSYKTLALESRGINGFDFVWFTDGIGWNSARNNLKETFDVLEHLYNLKDLEDGCLLSLKNK